MRQKVALVILTFLLTVTYQAPSWAGRILEKIKRTGVITAGTRKDSIPFAYINDKGEWVGYSLDILQLIRQQVEEELGKPIELKLVEVNPQNRFPKIVKGSIDIECGSTTFTWKREKYVDFSVSYFGSGTQMLVRKGSDLTTIDSLAGKRIAVVPKTTNEAAIKMLQPLAKLVLVKDRLEGWQQLQQGKIDGFASDGILLEGIRRTAANPNDFEIVPDNPYIVESYACILPQDESQWRDLVNYTLVKFMEEVVSDRSEAVDIYERWFGTDGVTPYSREQINDYFLNVINTFEWIPIPGRY